MRTLTYSRVSTSHHDQNPDIQVQELHRYCTSRGWEVQEAIVDHAGGGTDKRDGLQRLFQLVKAGEVDCIVVTKLDRLFRSLRQLITTLDDFQARGIVFVAVKDSVDYSSPAGRLFTQILGSLAEFEKELVRERTLAGLHYARTVKGKVLGRPKAERNLELMRHLRADGMSATEIGRMLNCSHMTVIRALKLLKSDETINTEGKN